MTGNNLIESKFNNLPCRPKWHKDSQQKYVNGLDGEKIDSVNNALTRMLSNPVVTNEHNTQTQVNSFGFEITDIIKNAADTTLKKKKK